MKTVSWEIFFISFMFSAEIYTGASSCNKLFNYKYNRRVSESFCHYSQHDF
jgi:hypothetical protein